VNTAERAAALSQAAQRFPLLGKVDRDDLIEVVRLELGHPEILDGFRPYAGHFSLAIADDPLLHILSGNTPHAGLQSLMRGLLLGAMNYVKIPANGLREVEEFAKMLPSPLKGRLDLSTELARHWLPDARAWIVFGTDETIAYFRSKAPPGIVLEAHPHRVSLEIVFDDSRGDSSPLAAADISRFNQKGCLSPHDVYVSGDARSYAVRLAKEMARYEQEDPRGPVTSPEAAEIADMRANYRFRSANDPRVGIWESDNSTAWTVIYEEDAWFATSCLNRLVFVKPLPADLTAALGPALPWVAAVGIWPATPENAEKAALLQPSRVCPVGQLQYPPLSWHQEGRQTLAPLVRWVDFEPDFR
jgi:Acyl-CoA reductase (LuxC)